jgi:guanylate kinase
MKSNLSKKDIESGKNIIDILLKTNSKLSPHILKDIIPDYKKFFPHPDKYGLWSSPKTKNKKFNQKYDKVMLLLSGVTAGGKDAIREEMERLAPNLFKKTITGTSRPPRPGETHGKDYYFFENQKIFKQSIKNNEFIEYIKRGETFYGLSKKSLNKAIKHPSPIVYSQIEMSGWSKVERYISHITETKIFTLKVFVMPDMNFSQYKEWLIQKRSDNDLNSRLNKTGWEIKRAAKKADFIITNRIRENGQTLTYTAQTIINQVTQLLNSSNFPQFPPPFNIDKELTDIEEILNLHDSIK